MAKINTDRKLRRKFRVSKNLVGTPERPRIQVFRSNRYIYAQAIDDTTGRIMASCSSLVLKKVKDAAKVKKTEESKKIGEVLGGALLKKGVKAALFDRSSYAYHGRVQNLAEGLRSAGLTV